MVKKKHLRLLQDWLERKNRSWLGETDRAMIKAAGKEEEISQQRRREEHRQRQLSSLKVTTRILSLHEEEREDGVIVSAYIERNHLYQQAARLYEEAREEWVTLHLQKVSTGWQIRASSDPPTQARQTSSQIMQIAEHSEMTTSQGYQPLQAVAYAEKYWNSYNPAFRYFATDDCTNFVSQCLLAGGFPMVGGNRRDQGWWYRHAAKGRAANWSYSWAVAHSFYLFLLQLSQKGQRVQRMSSPYELQRGDVICYDFEGDGRWNHNTLVTAKDADGAPLVHAHTDNSRYRFWQYTDSPAYTPQIQYAFFHIVR